MLTFATTVIVLVTFFPNVIITQSPIAVGTDNPAATAVGAGTTGPSGTTPSDGGSTPLVLPPLIPAVKGFEAQNCSSMYAVRGNETMAFSRGNETAALCMTNFTAPIEYHCAVRQCFGSHICSSCTEVDHHGNPMAKTEMPQNCSLAYFAPGLDPQATHPDPNPLALCITPEKKMFECSANNCTGATVCLECLASSREDFEGASGGNTGVGAGTQDNTTPGSNSVNNGGAASTSATQGTSPAMGATTSTNSVSSAPATSPAA